MPSLQKPSERNRARLIKQYRKKPVIIEAVKYTAEKHNQIQEEFCGQLEVHLIDLSVYVRTLEGAMKVDEGDFIIKGVKGEFYPCKADIFEATYDEVFAKSAKAGCPACNYSGKRTMMLPSLPPQYREEDCCCVSISCEKSIKYVQASDFT